MATANIPSISTFDETVGEDKTAIGATWDEWLERFENYMGALAITNDGRLRKMLLHLVGPRTFKEFQTLTETGTTFDEAKAKLTAHFKPKVVVEYEESVFRNMTQKKGEKIDSYHVRLRQQATRCSFDSIDKELKSHIIRTTTDSRLRQKVLKGSLAALDDVLKEGHSNELCKSQSADIERNLKTEPANTVRAEQGQRSNKQCNNCNGSYPHPKDRESRVWR